MPLEASTTQETFKSATHTLQIESAVSITGRQTYTYPLTTPFFHFSPLFSLEGNKDSGAPRIRSQVTPQHHQ